VFKGIEMLKPLVVLLIAGSLAACASEPEAGEAEREAAAPVHLACYQANWQAETVPVIYKRGGQAVLEKYEFMPDVGPVACR
jgi:hypothetical protein